MDKENLKKSVIVYDNDSNIENNELVKSKEIICPECGENSIIKIENYKISLFGCKNKHEKKDISFFDFDKTQLIDESKIKCNICKDNNKSKSYKKQFYKCNSCKFNLCPLCKSAHDKSHNIIDYDLYNYLCERDN